MDPTRISISLDGLAALAAARFRPRLVRGVRELSHSTRECWLRVRDLLHMNCPRLPGRNILDPPFCRAVRWVNFDPACSTLIFHSPACRHRETIHGADNLGTVWKTSSWSRNSCAPDERTENPTETQICFVLSRVACMYNDESHSTPT